jgi:hypothetical protein
MRARRQRVWALAVWLAVFGVYLACGASVPGATAGEPANPYSAWSHGPARDPQFFPLAVWLQDPKNAPKYRDLGINTYVALWRGPTEEQLNVLRQHGMKLICSQNERALRLAADDLIIAWMHGDEPDNAQSLGEGKGYGPPVAPQRIVADYRAIRERDPQRPVLLNLGQGVAWDGWHGRGVRTNHPEDYVEYLAGCDIASFDIYPAVHDRPAVAGKLWYVPFGVTRLRRWGNNEKGVWNCIECTRISNTAVKPTPDQVKAEVWMSIIHGSRGLIYFCHQFQPEFIEAGLLADADMSNAVRTLNRRILDLAPVIHGPPVESHVQLQCDPAELTAECRQLLGGQPVAFTVRRWERDWYLFAVGMDGQKIRATFSSPELRDALSVEVLDEQRTLALTTGGFSDDFAPYAVHLYRIRGR